MSHVAPRVVLRRGRAKPIWMGHPRVYSEALANGEAVRRGRPGGAGAAPAIEAGSLVDVMDDGGRLVGRGFYHPRSQIRVRMWTRADEPAGEDLLRRRLVAAQALRARLGLPSAQTDAYRLVNSEGDGLPGLIVDVYGRAVVMQFTALGLEKRREELVLLLWELLSPTAIFEAKPGAYAEVEGLVSQPGLRRGNGDVEVRCSEGGLQFSLDLSAGESQKTGLFLDQRENRARVRQLARGARVLDAYTYHGGFALAALAGGATEVTAVDVSARALDHAQRNAAENGLSPLALHASDVPEFLSRQVPRSYDLVVLDPPKFARARKDYERALGAYRKINALAMSACKSGGMLCTSSCSGTVDELAFERMLSQASLDARCHVQILERHAMGPDHPVPAGFPEGRYLKFFVCSVTSWD